MEAGNWIALGGLFSAGVGMLIATFRIRQNQINALHERVNRVRDEYVRRIDLDSRLARVDKSLEKLGSDVQNGQREIAGRFDALILAVASNTRSRVSEYQAAQPRPVREAGE